MKTLKYNEIMPRIAIEKLKLIEEQDLIDLAGKNLEAIRCSLLETSYKEEIIGASPQEKYSISLEEALLENYAKTLKNLVKFSSGNLRQLILAIIGKFESSNIKTLLRATKAKMNTSEAVGNIIPVGILNKNQCQNILSNSKTIEDVIEHLFDTKYGIILQKGIAETKTSNNLLPLESILDQHIYREIRKIVTKFKGIDKIIAKNVLGIEVEIKNIKIILRGKSKGIPKTSIRKYLLPSFFINEQETSNLLETSDVKALIEGLFVSTQIANNTIIKRILLQILENQNLPLVQIENMLEKVPLSVSLEMQKEYQKYYNMSYVLVLLNFKWIEIKNLRSLIIGSKRKINPSIIKSSLILQKN